MNKYQKPATIVVKLKYETLLQTTGPSGSTTNGGDSRELRSAWKDDEE